MTGVRVKVDNDLGGIGIYHKEYICTQRQKVRLYIRGVVTRICVGTWVQLNFTLLGVDDVKFLSPNYKVYECNDVRDVLVVVSSNNRIYNKALVDEEVNDPGGVLITETPEIITVSMGEQLYVNHVFKGIGGDVLPFCLFKMHNHQW